MPLILQLHIILTYNDLMEWHFLMMSMLGETYLWQWAKQANLIVAYPLNKQKQTKCDTLSCTSIVQFIFFF